MKCHRWTAEQLAWIQANLHMTKAEMAEAISQLFGFPCSESKVASVFKNHRIRCGRTGRFEKGQVPYNKGKKGVNGKSSSTFKTGNRPHNWLPVGSERIVGEIVEVKVADPHQWQRKHVLIWEKTHGPVPSGHVVIFADRDRKNFAIENLLLVSREELAVMNKRRLVTAHPEATKVGKTVAKLVIACGGKAHRRNKLTAAAGDAGVYPVSVY